MSSKDDFLRRDRYGAPTFFHYAVTEQFPFETQSNASCTLSEDRNNEFLADRPDRPPRPAAAPA
jgi:hypothetical protein